MGTPLENVSFLVRSENRVAVLDALATGSAVRGELGESTGIGRITLSRVLRDFTERGWIICENDQYALTSVGKLVHAAFEELLDAMAIAEEFGTVADLVPMDDDFDLGWLSDANKFVSTASDPFRPLRRAIEGLESTTTLTLLTNATAGETIEVMWQRATAGELVIEAVLDDSTLKRIIQNPDTHRLLLELLERDSVQINRYDGTVPYILAVLDDRVHLGLSDAEGGNVVLIESSNTEVRAWASRTFETYRRKATHLDPSDADLRSVE